MAQVAIAGAGAEDRDRTDTRRGLGVDSLCRSVLEPVAGVARPADRMVVRGPPGAPSVRKVIGKAAGGHPQKERLERSALDAGAAAQLAELSPGRCAAEANQRHAEQ